MQERDVGSLPSKTKKLLVLWNYGFAILYTQRKEGKEMIGGELERQERKEREGE